MVHLRQALISACDAAIITMMLSAGLAYVFRWPIAVVAAVSILAKVL